MFPIVYKDGLSAHIIDYCVIDLVQLFLFGEKQLFPYLLTEYWY